MLNKAAISNPKTSAISWQYLLQETALILIFSFILLFTQNSLVSPSILAVTAGLLSLLAAAYLFIGRYAPSELDLPALAFLAALALTSFTSIDPRRSFAETWLIALPFFLLFVVSALARKGWPPELFIKTLLIAGGIVIGFSLLDALQWYLHWLQVSPGQWIPAIVYRLPAPNFLAVITNIFLMLALARLIESRAWPARIFLGLYSLAAVAVLYLTSSRGGWIGTIGGFGALGLTIVLANPRKWRAIWDRLRVNRLAMAGLALALIAAAGLFAWVMIRQSSQPTHGPLLSSRGYLWGPAWKAFLRSPIIGVGPFTYISLFLQENSVPPTEMFPYAHNIYLDVLSSSGLVGFAAFAWLGLTLARGLYKRLLATTGLERSVVAGASAALGAFAVHGLFDSVHHTLPTALWVMLIVLGVAMGTGVARSTSRARGWALRALGLVVVAAAWWFLSLALPLSAGVTFANAGEWGRAAGKLSEAAQRDPTSAISQQQLGLAEGYLAKQGDTQALDRSIAAFERAVAIDPYWSLNHANLGALYRARGDLAAARAEWRQAVQRAPQATLFVLRYGEALEESGETAQAQETYRQALEQAPAWIDAGFWDETALRQAARDGWLREHPAGSPSISELEAKLVANPSEVVAYLPLIRAYLDAGRLVDAARIAQEAHLAQTTLETDWLDLQWLEAEIAAARGDYAQAVSLGQASIDRQRALIAYTPGFTGGRGYGPWMFRQVTMGVETVPQLEGVWALGESERMIEDWRGRE